MPQASSRSRPEVRRQLEAAAAHQSLIRVYRSIRRSDKLEGFVVGIGDAWVLLALLDPNIYLNGYVAVRLQDVSTVAVRGGEGTFVGRALAARGHWPPVGTDVELDRVADLIRGAGSTAPLVTVHVEIEDPQVCHIGRPIGFTSRSVYLHEILPDARWENVATPWPLRDITRVEFGGRYEEALAMVAEPPPEVLGPRTRGQAAPARSLRPQAR